MIRIKDLTHWDKEKIKAYFCREKEFFPEKIEREVAQIIDRVKQEGDRAVSEYSRLFDSTDLSPDRFRVSREEVEQGCIGIEQALEEALEESISRVQEFHRRQLPGDWAYVDGMGNLLGQKCTPVKRVGVYIPGGKACYPSSLVMTAVPAMVAGVNEIAVLSPPRSFQAPSALCAAIRKLGLTKEVYRIGGVQGVAALGFGTESVKKVDKIAGPGSIYVAIAKKQLFGYVDVDMVAGPSEVLVIADGSVNPRFTAADLLAQAEHDQGARAICVTTSREHAGNVQKWTEELYAASSRKGIIETSLTRNGKIYLVDNLDKACLVADSIGPEHLEIHTADPSSLLHRVKNAGAVFLGALTPEAFGDYIAGPSHVLPTGGTSRFFSPINVFSFLKFTSIVQMSATGAERLGKSAQTIAESEGLFDHSRSIKIRRESTSEG